MNDAELAKLHADPKIKSIAKKLYANDYLGQFATVIDYYILAAELLKMGFTSPK